MLLASTSSKQDSAFSIHILSHPCPVNEEYIPVPNVLVWCYHTEYVTFNPPLSVIWAYMTLDRTTHISPLLPAPSTSIEDWQRKFCILCKHPLRGLQAKQQKGYKDQVKRKCREGKIFHLHSKIQKVNSDKIDSRTVCILFQQYLLPYGTFKYWVWKGKKRTQGSLVKNAPEVWRQQPSLLLDIQTFSKLFWDFFLFFLGILYCYDQTLDSHFQVILHDFHTEEVLNIRFQETSQTLCILLFSPA